MSKRPTGTVTLLFTDIEGSTRLLHSLGERYEQVLGLTFEEAVQFGLDVAADRPALVGMDS